MDSPDKHSQFASQPSRSQSFSPPVPPVVSPVISVVLPFFNQAEYLRPAIDSVLEASKYPLELILINDGSTDKAGVDAALAGIVGQGALFRPETGRPEAGPIESVVGGCSIRYFETENRRLPAALNLGFSNCCGLFLGWTSADNLYRPGALDRLADHLFYDPEIDLVYDDVQLIDSAGAPYRGSNYRIAEQDPSDSSILRLPREAQTLPFFPDNFINAYILFRRRSYLNSGEHRIDLNGLEDFDYWLRIGVFGKIVHATTDRNLNPSYCYRLHPNSMTGTIDAAALAAKTEKRQSAAADLSDRLAAGLKLNIEYGSNRDELEHIRSIFSGSGIELNPILTPRADSDSLTLTLLGRASRPFTEPGQRSIFSQVGDRAQLVIGAETLDSGRQSATQIYTPGPIRRLALLDFDSQGAGLFHVTGYSADRIYSSLTPVDPPEILRRSRDSNFGAVVPAAGSIGTALILVPEDQFDQEDFIEKTLPLIEAAPKAAAAGKPELTFLLLAATVAARSAADKINLNLKNNSHLRIIDLTERSGNRSNLIESAMYVLASIDLILTIPVLSSTLARANQLRADLALGAASARNVVSPIDLSEWPACARTGYTDRAGNSSRCSKDAELFAGLSILEAPHLFGVDPKQLPDAVIRRCIEAIKRPERSWCDGWLREHSPAGVVRHILALMCRK